jgi:hypothetical protein
MKNKRSGKSRIQITIFLLSIFILFFPPFYLEASERQSIKVKANDSISFLCFKIYGRFNPEMTKQFVKINPHIKDWDNLAEGE